MNCIFKQISKAPDCIIPAFYCAAVRVNTQIKGLDSSLTLLSVCSKTLTCALLFRVGYAADAIANKCALTKV